MSRLFFLISLCLLFAASCTPSRHSGCRVERELQCRTGMDAHWNRSPCSPVYLEEKLNALLSAPLDAEASAQVALWNSPRIQVILEEIGIAQSELHEAMLLPNPVVEASFRNPCHASGHMNIEYNVLQALMEIILWPKRVDVAHLMLCETEKQVVQEVLDVIADVKRTCIALQALKANMPLWEEQAAAAEIRIEVAQRQIEAGNIEKIKASEIMLEAHDVMLAYEEARCEQHTLREELAGLLGLDGEGCWTIQAALPEVEELNALDIEGVALCRPDLEAARLEILRLARTGSLKQWWTYTEIAAGYSTEKEVEGERVAGPVVELAIPIFNYGQAERARLLSELRQSQYRYRDLEIKARAEVRRILDEVRCYAKLYQQYQDVILPAQQEAFSQAQRLYDVMNLGVYELVERKAKWNEAEMRATEMKKRYWQLRADLDRATGGSL